jgi:hypothetical protein
MPGGAGGQGTGMDSGAKAPSKPVEELHAGHGDHGSHRGKGDSSARQKADMLHDMGHAPGMSMQDMVRDMRNRFLVALVFAVPVFLYSPMGKMFGEFATPFGLDRKLFLFIVATGAIVCPVWAFWSLTGGLRATRSPTWRRRSFSQSARAMSSAWEQPSSTKARCSTKHRPCFWCSSCWVTGWKCMRAPAHLTRSAR